MRRHDIAELELYQLVAPRRSGMGRSSRSTPAPLGSHEIVFMTSATCYLRAHCLYSHDRDRAENPAGRRREAVREILALRQLRLHAGTRGEERPIEIGDVALAAYAALQRPPT
jgi:hypothetical protein